MCAARRADCRASSATDLLFSFTVKTLDESAVLLFPKLLKSAEKGGVGWSRSRRVFAEPQLETRLRRKRRKITAALATNRTLCRRIFHLLEATMWTFKTDFCRRRTGHRTLTPGFPLLSAPSKRCLDRLAGSHNFRPCRGLRGNGSAGDFGFANKGRSLFNDKTRCFQITL